MNDLLQRALSHIRSTQWQYRNAAENQYCECCATEADRYRDQHQHHTGCSLVTLMADLERAIEEIEEMNGEDRTYLHDLADRIERAAERVLFVTVEDARRLREIA